MIFRLPMKSAVDMHLACYSSYRCGNPPIHSTKNWANVSAHEILALCSRCMKCSNCRWSVASFKHLHIIPFLNYHKTIEIQKKNTKKKQATYFFLRSRSSFFAENRFSFVRSNRLNFLFWEVNWRLAFKNEKMSFRRNSRIEKSILVQSL